MSRPDRVPAPVRDQVRQRAGAMLFVLVAVAVAGCAGAPDGSVGGSASPAGSASYEELTQAFLAYAQCARTHGMPDLPDPVVDQQGNDSYPPLSANGSPHWSQAVLTGCASVWDHVHEVRARYDSSHGLAARANDNLTPAQALAFSRCVRVHGFPDYPDPAANGQVPSQPPGFQKPALSAPAIRAIQICTQQVARG